ncbi:MAG: hypothetical protein ABFD82_21145 [Syntrophaceae bacterium]
MADGGKYSWIMPENGHEDENIIEVLQAHTLNNTHVNLSIAAMEIK